MNRLNYKNPDLSEFEKEVLFNKATERAFTGVYDDFYKPGDYACKNCGALLYSSKAKFDAGCGWPAFDDCYKDAITYLPDQDGRRVEIVCSNCQGHLGHVFVGEKLTSKDTRHCVNSASIKFIKNEENTIRSVESVILGCGCFWGVEYYFKKLKGVLGVKVGYSGGDKVAGYEEVCGGQTGHYEVVKIDYDSNVVSYEEVIKYFFEIHDFEQTSGQGNDLGQQYKSVIFYSSQEELEKASEVKQELEDMGYKVATKILEAKEFYEGELYHQDYYTKTGGVPYCHSYKKIWQQDHEK